MPSVLQCKSLDAHFTSMALFFVMFIVGWNDASQGPLLPLLQDYYNVCSSSESCIPKAHIADIPKVNYTVISVIWIAIAVGVMTAAVSNVFLADILGFGLVSILGLLAARQFMLC